MNKQRRRRIEDIVSQLMDLQSEIEEIRDEEQEIVDNTPDSLQGTERFEIAEAAADNLENACSDMESLIDYLNQSAE